MTSSIPPSGSTSKLAFPGAILVGKYRLEEIIGVGGMGSVWLATHQGLNQQIALKLVSANFARSTDALRRFDTEAKAAAKIKSRHVPQVYDNGVLEDGTPFLAMELLHGETLFSRVHRGGPVPLPEAVMIVEHCCRGLGRAHTLGIIHRDIKPENIFLAQSVDDDNYVVKVLDFGIAKIKNPLEAGEQSTTRTGSLLGTPMFMSPEQARGLRSIDHRTDLYSLGLVTYMMFTGNMVFSGETLGELLLQICTQPLPSLLASARWLPPAMEDWFQKACAREPDQRFQTAQAFVEAMRIAAGISTGPERSGSFVPSVQSQPQLPGASIPVSMPVGRPAGPMDLRPPSTLSDATVPNRTPAPAMTPSTHGPVAVDGTQAPAVGGGRGKLVAALMATAVVVALAVAGVMLATRRHEPHPPVAAAPPPSIAAVVPPPAIPSVALPSATLAATGGAPSAIPSASVAATVKPAAPPPPVGHGGAATPVPKPPPAAPKPGNVDLGY